MKSAEEWYSEGGWNNDLNAIKSIKEIQLDSWKQGMTDAVALAHGHRFPVPKDLIREIETERDYKTTL